MCCGHADDMSLAGLYGAQECRARRSPLSEQFDTEAEAYAVELTVLL